MHYLTLNAINAIFVLLFKIALSWYLHEFESKNSHVPIGNSRISDWQTNKNGIEWETKMQRNQKTYQAQVDYATPMNDWARTKQSNGQAEAS